LDLTVRRSESTIFAAALRRPVFVCHLSSFFLSMTLFETPTCFWYDEEEGGGAGFVSFLLASSSFAVMMMTGVDDVDVVVVVARIRW